MEQLGLTRRVAVIGALALSLALPAYAPAAAKKVYRLEGRVGGDANSIVSMKVVTKRGEPKKVKAFTWRGLDGVCDGAAAREQSGSFSTSTKPAALGNFRVFGPYDQAQTDADVADISGFVKKKGKKVVDGLISVRFDDGLCGAPPLGAREFTAKKV